MADADTGRGEAMVRLTAAPDVRKRLQDLGIDARAGAPGELRERLVADIAKWRAVIEKANIPRQ
jgi:tripartite-type tricarboxylate transporter receptor subunit TctC